MSYHVKRFNDLSTVELYEILKLRTEVFVVEQECAYLEVDGKDLQSFHLYCVDGEEIVAYLRILPPGVSYEELSIGRVVVRKSHRGRQIGRELMNEALQFIGETLKEQAVKIQAQDYLRAFYESFGFKAISEVYLEDGIPHLDMLLMNR